MCMLYVCSLVLFDRCAQAQHETTEIKLENKFRSFGPLFIFRGKCWNYLQAVVIMRIELASLEQKKNIH